MFIGIKDILDILLVATLLYETFRILRLSGAVNLFLHQCVLRGGLPFAVEMPRYSSETLAASYCREYGLNVRLARPAYIYGAASMDDDRVWAQFIANVVRGEDILLKSNGAAKRSFCYVTDTAKALLTILLNGENALPYNIAYEKSDVTIRDFAGAACEAFPERNIRLRFQNPEDEREPVEKQTPLRQVPEILNSERLKALGWQPQVDLITGIQRAVAILEEQIKD